MKLGIRDICQINDINALDLNKIFCSICNSFLSNSSKLCSNTHCKYGICEKCFTSNKSITCPHCKNNNFVNYNSEKQDYPKKFKYFCKSNKCIEKYSYEIMLKKHIHCESKNILYCYYCKINLSLSPNFLKCFKCKQIYCHQNINYIPFTCESESTKKNNKEKQLLCITRCYYCYNPICIKCEKNINKYKNIICSNCKKKCDVCSKKNAVTLCNICDNNLCENCLKTCDKCSLILCEQDYEKYKKCEEHSNTSVIKNCKICNKNKISATCQICNNEICSTSCMVLCNSEECTNQIICKNCTKFCNICKKIYCNKCSIFCTNCTQGESLVSCKNCNSDIFRKCSFKGCLNTLCIKCVNYCNYCKEICCPMHSLKCGNCNENICRFHWHICRKCNTKKVCLKNCTYKCFLCNSNNEINALCLEENHPLDFCKSYKCQHKICNSCIKKCDKCGKIIQTCTQCLLENVYSHCRFCNKDFCYECSNQCLKCGEFFCKETHFCYLCKKEIDKMCPNCDFKDRSKCMICSKSLIQCCDCFKKIICSPNCFLENYNKIKKKYSSPDKRHSSYYYYQSGIKFQKGNSSLIRSLTGHSSKTGNYKIRVTNNMANNMISSVVNLFSSGSNNTNNNILKDKNSLMRNDSKENEEQNEKLNINKYVIEKEEKHLCLMYWCNEHLGESELKPKINSIRGVLSKDSTNACSGKNSIVEKIENKEKTFCSFSCNIY